MASKKYANKSSTGDSATNTVLEKTLKRFKESWDYQQANWHDTWDRDNRLYDGERVRANYEGTTDTFVPMTFSTVETMVSAFTNSSPRFDYKTGDPLKKIDTRPFNVLVDEWWSQGQWDLDIEEGSREVFITGMAGAMFYWEGDHPELEMYAMRDIILDPTVRKPSDLQKPGAYAGRRFYVRKGALDDFEVVDTDPKSKTYGQMVKRYKSDGYDSRATAGELTDKEIKEMFTGSTLTTAKDDQDEIIEIWDVDHVVTVKNRCEVIEDRVNPHKLKHETQLLEKYLEEEMAKTDELGTPVDPLMAQEAAAKKAKAMARGLVTFFFFRNYRRLSLFYAKSEIDSIAKEQELLNDLTNMESDYIIRQLAPQKELDPAYKDFIDLINNDPDTVYPFPPGTLVDRPVPTLPPNSFNNRMNIKNEIRESTAIDQVAKGAANVKETTATEVQAQLNQAGMRIESKARIFERDGFYWMAWQLMKLAQLYVDGPILVEVPGMTNEETEAARIKYGIDLPTGVGVFDPADYGDDWRPQVTLEIDSQNKKIEAQKMNTQAFQAIIQDPTNNLQEAKRRLYPKMWDIDQEDLDAIMTPAPAVGLPGDPMAAMGGEVPPVEGAPIAEVPPNV